MAEADEPTPSYAAREATERAAHAHDRLTDVLLHGGGVVEVADGAGARCSAAGSRCTTTRVACSRATARGRRGSSRRGVADAAAVRALRPDRRRRLGRRRAPRGRSTSARSCCAPTRTLDLPERRTLERGALVTALVLLFGRTEAEAESRVRGELLADLVERAATSTPTGCASAPGSRAPTSTTRRWRSRSPSPPTAPASGRGRAVASTWPRAARASAGVHDGVVVVLAPGRAARPSASRCATRLGRRHGRRRHRRRAAPTAIRRRLARGPADASTRCSRLGRTGEVSDPAGLGLARLLLGGNGPEELEEFVDRTLGPVLDYDAERGTRLAETLEAWFATGGASARPPSGCTSTPTPSTQRLDRVGQLLGDGLARPGPQARRAARAADGAAALGDM